MNILVTGAKGFVGKNLVANLRNIAQGKNRTRPNLHIEEIFEYDLDTDPALLGSTAPGQISCSIWPGSTGLRTTRSSWRATLAFPPLSWKR